jgi:carbon storage regulator CsrA
MLVLSRKKNESIVVNHDIVITVIEVRGDKVRLGIVAPRDASVHRQEVYELIHGRTVAPPQGPGDRMGKPFPPISLDPEWLTSTVVALARGMCESRDFSPLPILADALQDAGCDNDDILNHCRDATATHSGGCWVVDLVLAKS